MNFEEYNDFCASIGPTTYVMQWGGSHVWKIGGKVFVIARFDKPEPSFSFKVSHIAYEILREQPGLRPAPYLASRGMKWIQHYAEPGLSPDALRDHIRESYALVTQRLTKKLRTELGLTQ